MTPEERATAAEKAMFDELAGGSWEQYGKEWAREARRKVFCDQIKDAESEARTDAERKLTRQVQRFCCSWPLGTYECRHDQPCSTCIDRDEAVAEERERVARRCVDLIEVSARFGDWRNLTNKIRREFDLEADA